MMTLLSIALIVSNSYFAQWTGTFTCEVSELGLSSAVSVALGQGVNSDSFIEGSLVTDLGLPRETAETIVNQVHNALFGGETSELVTSDC